MEKKISSSCRSRGKFNQLMTVYNLQFYLKLMHLVLVTKMKSLVVRVTMQVQSVTTQTHVLS